MALHKVHFQTEKLKSVKQTKKILRPTLVEFTQLGTRSPLKHRLQLNFKPLITWNCHNQMSFIVANVWPMELSVLCTLLRLLQVKHLRFNGLKVKFDNYHQMVRKVFSLRFGFKLKRWYWPCKMHYNVCCWEVYHLQSRSSYVLKTEGWEDPKRQANSENKINNALFLVNRPACIDKQ